MTDLTTYLEAEIMDWSFRNTDMNLAPDSVWIALHTGDPGEDGTLNEVAAADYDRVEVLNPAGWTGTGSDVSNANAINFGVATSVWGTISHFSVWDGPNAADAATNPSNPLWKSALGAAKTIEANDELRFDAGALTATID